MGDSIKDFLATSPVFSEVPPEQLEDIAPLFRRERHPAGTIVLRQGGYSEAVYFVRSGQLAVRILRSGWRETIAYLQPPDVFGELSFVTGRACVADVEVLVDAEVLLLPREVIPKIPHERDTILRSLMKVIAGRLQETVLRGTKVREAPVVLLLNSPAWEAPRSFAWELARSLARQSGHNTLLVNLGLPEARPVREIAEKFSVCEMTSGGASEKLRSEVAERLTDWKRQFESVILNPVGRDASLVAGSTGQFANWIGFLFGPGDAAPADVGSRRFVVQSSERPTLPILSGNRQLISEASESESEHRAGRPVTPRFRRTVDSIARYIAGLQVGLALGGGAAWGWAHVGVLSVLEEAGLPIDVLSGCSMGSAIAAFYSVGFSVEDLKKIAQYWRTRTRRFLNSRVLWELCLINQRKVRKALHEYFQEQEVNRTAIPYWANAVDIRTGMEYSIQTGSLVDCVLASIALPGLLPPYPRDSHLLVDAGIMDPVPVSLLKHMGCHYAIGVNAMAELESQEVSKRNPAKAVEVLIRSMFLMGHEIGQARAEQAANILFTPSLGNITLLQFSRSPEIIECGQRAAEAHLPAILEGYERLKSSAWSPQPALPPAFSRER